MQSDIGSQSLSGGSQLSFTASATAPAHPIDDVFEITQEDASILEAYIKEFKKVSFNKKDSDRVLFLISNEEALKLMQYIKFTHKWSARNTFYHLHRDEVMLEAEQMSGAHPGMASFISGKIIRDFQAQLFKTCGIQCVVLTAHKHENGSIITGIDEANNLLDDGTHFHKYCPNWKDAPLFREWQKYAKMCFRGDYGELIPLLGYVSGKKKATISWAKLSQNPPSWIKTEYVSDGFQWADPSKLHIGNVFKLLKHWRQRKQDCLEPLIWVSSCPLLKDVKQPSKHCQAPKQQQGHDTDVGDSNDSSDLESSATSSSNDPSSSNANHSALPNSDDNSTEDEESENFNLENSPPHSLSSPQASNMFILSLIYMKWCLILYIGSFQGGRRYTSTPSSPTGTQCRSTPEMEQTLSPDHILEERQERQGHNRDYDSGPDDSGAFQSSLQGSFNKLNHGKQYMDTGRSVGGINTHFLQRQWCASGCSKMEESTPTYQSAEMHPGSMKAVQKWTCTLQSVESPPSSVSSVQAVRPGWRSEYILTRLQKCTLVLPVILYGDVFYFNHWLACGWTKVAE
ncbi:hypothetical protein BJY52DRAFT_1228837 [Lactarius psammicola]|nr:hypothetical protein BJY52DRAFT_1228837 [Lactarius psammicola]